MAIQEALPGATELAEFVKKNEGEKELTPQLRSILEVAAVTGSVWHSWDDVKVLLAFVISQVLEEFEAERVAAAGVGPPRPLKSGETFAEMLERLLSYLEAFSAGPPFTVQRICEVLLNARASFSNLDRVAFALEKLLLVTSSAPPPSEPYPPLPLDPQRLAAVYLRAGEGRRPGREEGKEEGAAVASGGGGGGGGGDGGNSEQAGAQVAGGGDAMDVGQGHAGEEEGGTGGKSSAKHAHGGERAEGAPRGVEEDAQRGGGEVEEGGMEVEGPEVPPVPQPAGEAGRKGSRGGREGGKEGPAAEGKGGPQQQADEEMAEVEVSFEVGRAETGGTTALAATAGGEGSSMAAGGRGEAGGSARDSSGATDGSETAAGRGEQEAGGTEEAALAEAGSWLVDNPPA